MTPQTLFAFGLASLVVLAACLLVRLACGVPVAQLVRTRGYEIPPLRLLFHTLHVAAWGGFIVSGLIAVRYTFALLGTGSHAGVVIAAVPLTALFYVLRRTVRRTLVEIPKNPPPFVCVDEVETQHGIDREHLSTLGQEQFPQCLVYGHTAGVWTRVGLMLAAFALALVFFAGSGDDARKAASPPPGLSLVKAFRLAPTALPHPPAVAVLVAVSCGLALLLLLIDNAGYTLVTFAKAAPAKFILGFAAWLAVAKAGATDSGLAQLAALVSLACGVRWAHDLRRAWRFRITRRVSEPIAARVATVVPDLAQFKARPDCKMPVPDVGDLSARISRGCRNVEEASPLVTRNLARFLSLVKVEYEQFAAAMLRFLTVRRFVSTSGGCGTYRAFQCPSVPMWNERLFPLHPPTGFRDWLDPLPLGSEWDVVTTCPRCGGTGRVRRTETYTETQNGQTVTRTREVEETCPQCGGAGRVVYQQTLNTHWQRLIPACTDPHVEVPEFMEDAEERTYYRVPLVEDRESLTLAPRHDGKIGSDLRAELRQAVEELAGELPEFAERVEKLHDGILYRADFQVTGFWTTRIAFRRLPGKVGWFFGARPEFHFPALPLSWGAAGTVTFVLPFLAMTLLAVVSGVAGWLSTALPVVK